MLFGWCFVLCWRCTGLILGGLLGSFLHHAEILNFTNDALSISIFSTPFVVDVLVQQAHYQESTNTRRYLTGVLFGIALANFRPF